MWPKLEFSPDLVTFTEEILNRKTHFLYSGIISQQLLRKDSFIIWYIAGTFSPILKHFSVILQTILNRP